MRVAPLSVAELDQYRALMLEAYAKAPDAFTSTAEERAAAPPAWWQKRIADPAGMSIAFGAFAGTALVGTVALEFSSRAKTAHKAHLVGMYVQPAARGAGAGRLLVETAMAFASSRSDLAVVTLTVSEGNAPAMALYESCGFQTFGVEPMAVRGESGYINKVHMWAPLGGAQTAVKPLVVRQ